MVVMKSLMMCFKDNDELASALVLSALYIVKGLIGVLMKIILFYWFHFRSNKSKSSPKYSFTDFASVHIR
jgi:hypothetical protein